MLARYGVKYELEGGKELVAVPTQEAVGHDQQDGGFIPGAPGSFRITVSADSFAEDESPQGMQLVDEDGNAFRIVPPILREPGDVVVELNLKPIDAD